MDNILMISFLIVVLIHLFSYWKEIDIILMTIITAAPIEHLTQTNIDFLHYILSMSIASSVGLLLFRLFYQKEKNNENNRY